MDKQQITYMQQQQITNMKTNSSPKLDIYIHIYIYIYNKKTFIFSFSLSKIISTLPK